MKKLFITQGIQFKKDFDKIRKQGKRLKLLLDIINILEYNLPIDNKYKDHALKGDYKGFRDIHIQPDWLLIYKIENDKLILYRTGSHSDLFK
jgi:mRNA interferase YafQ